MAGKMLKPVVEVDEYSRVLKYFESVRDAGLYTGCNPGVISTIINGYRKHYNGHKFRLAKPDEIAQFRAIINKIDAPKPVEEVPAPLPVEEKEPEEIAAQQAPADTGGLSAFEKMLLKIQKKI